MNQKHKNIEYMLINTWNTATWYSWANDILPHRLHYISMHKWHGAHVELRVDNVYEFAGFEQPIMVCCGYGGPLLNYNSRISCGHRKTLNGSTVEAKGCNDSSKYVNWDGIHYTEAANKHVSSQILTGKFSDPPLPQKVDLLLHLKFWRPIISLYHILAIIIFFGMVC